MDCRVKPGNDGKRKLRCERTSELPRRVQNPVAVAHQRRDAGEAAAAGAEVRAGRPAHHADDGEAAVGIAEHGRAGIAGAGAEAGADAAGRGSTDGFAGCRADRWRQALPRARAAAAAVAAHGDAVAGDDERIADCDGALAPPSGAARIFAEIGAASLSSATSAVARWPNKRLRSNCGCRAMLARVLERRLVRGVEVDELVVGARQHAVPGSQQQVARDRGRRCTKCRASRRSSPRIAPRLGGRLRAADHGGRGRER